MGRGRSEKGEDERRGDRAGGGRGGEKIMDGGAPQFHITHSVVGGCGKMGLFMEFFIFFDPIPMSKLELNMIWTQNEGVETTTRTV